MNENDRISHSKYTPEYVAIRRLRKKLRQIETLERCNRALQPEEQEKVNKKHDIRTELQVLVIEYERNTGAYEKDIDESERAHEEHGIDATTFSEIMLCDIDESKRITMNECRDATRIDDPPTMAAVATDTQVASCIQNDDNSTQSGLSSATNESKSIPDPTSLSDAPASTLTKRKHSPKKQKQTITETVPASTTPTKKAKTTKSESLKNIRKSWSQASVTATYLEGHNDLVTCVSVDGNHIISGSRDTTVKVHDLTSCSLLFSLGGHTNTVTCIHVLSPHQSRNLSDSNLDQCIISGSFDCSLRIWSMMSRRQLKEIYTFDPISSMTYIDENEVMVTGSEGGKISMWDLCQGEAISQITPFEDRVTGLQCKGGYLYSSCANGEVRVHEVKGLDLSCVFVSENVRLLSGATAHLSEIHCVTPHDGLLFIGDDGSNIKVLSWTTGTVRKLSNNIGEFGATDSICFNDPAALMLSSAYDIDHAMGYINLRTSKGGDYITTLSSPLVGRITCLACHQSDDDMTRIVSGGEDLIVWKRGSQKVIKPDSSTVAVIRPKYLTALAQSAVDSEAESDASDVDEAGDAEDIRRDSHRRLLSSDESDDGDKIQRSWMSRCTLL